MSLSERFRGRRRTIVNPPPESAALRGNLDPPEAFDWQTYGRTEQVLAGREGVGHEVPGVWANWMRRLGARDGATRQPDTETTASDAPP